MAGTEQLFLRNVIVRTHTAVCTRATNTLNYVYNVCVCVCVRYAHVFALHYEQHGFA